MALQERRHSQFVFFRRKGAGGIHQSAAGAYQLGAGVHDLLLPPGAHLHRLLAPIRYGRLFLPEHALTGARGIDQHLIKAAGQSSGQLFRMLIGHQGVSHAHPLDISAQDFCPLGVDLIAQQEAFSGHSSGNLGGLAAGSRAKIADPFAGLGIQQCHRSHSTGLLQIIYAGLVIRVQAGPGLGIIIIAHGLPGNRLLHKGHGWGLTLQGIKTQRHRSGPLQARQKSRVFLPQLLFHTLQKSLRQHSIPPIILHIIA